MRAWALILAAGEGSRMLPATGGVPKQFLPYRGFPLYWHCALTFCRCARIAGLVFVFPESCLERECARLRELDAAQPLALPWIVAPGGALRQDSVRRGLRALQGEDQAHHVLIHDTARPFASAALVNRVLDGLAAGACGVIPGIPVTDTIKIVRGDLVEATPERNLLRAVQTPQGFRLAPLAAAHRRAQDEGWVVTDDASLLERCGHPVLVVDGEAENRKITHPGDLAMLRPQTGDPQTDDKTPRVGFGYDVHRYAQQDAGKNARPKASADAQPARPLRLGGVLVPHAPEVLAHSDGDVLLHALADALLGCCGEGDIGLIFPDHDPACANLNSAVIVAEALDRLRRHDLAIIHADLTIIAEIPKVAPHREDIRRNLARLLDLDAGRVNVKATTEEGLGFTGAREGIKAVAVVTVRYDSSVILRDNRE
jgi:2-C-methyl-D-erythritol 4-phosphate cytidylyltransferase/2-C-methyl-D-erythritol 2,4-cyclodiphosphate synthase